MLIATQLPREKDYALRGTIELTIWPFGLAFKMAI